MSKKLSLCGEMHLHAGIGTLPYVYYGTEERKEKDTYQSSYAKTTAILYEQGTAWQLNGEKQWFTNVKVADVYVLFAKTSKI